MSVPLLESAAERFGRVLHTRAAGDFVLRLSEYEPSRYMPEHRHPLGYFCFVVRGRLEENCRGVDNRFDSGTLHFHAPGERHSGRVGSQGLTSLSIIPQGDLKGRAKAYLPASEAGRMAPLASRCYEAFRESDRASDLLLEAAALQLLAALLRREKRKAPAITPRWVHRVRDYLEANFAGSIALDDLAGIAGVHRVHVVRGFRRHVGMTPGAYLGRLRIEAARTALLESETPIVQIALEVGFSSQSHLTRAFHRQMGLPPGAFRRRYSTRPH